MAARLFPRSLFFFLSLFILGFASCSHSNSGGKRYPLEGRVVAVDAANAQLSVANKDIPGVMEAMTMPYIVAPNDRWIFGKIAPGDQLRATLVMDKDAELEGISFTKPAEASGAGASNMHVPHAGEEVPDITLTNQSGNTIRLRQFRGKPLLVTFIYTNCPFPEYCPRMSRNFQQILDQLRKMPAYDQTQLLSISIDPTHDTPAVLRKYGEGYAGRTDPNFNHWQFASGTPEQIRKAADFFGLSYKDRDGQIDHGLVTALVGKDGKVIKVYFGNDWKPADVAADVAAAA